jgi:hypothetical protein
MHTIHQDINLRVECPKGRIQGTGSLGENQATALVLCSAGTQIAQHVLQSCFFHDASSLGLYITCERLREVDTTALLREALQHGKSQGQPWFSSAC